MLFLVIASLKHWFLPKALETPYSSETYPDATLASCRHDPAAISDIRAKMQSVVVQYPELNDLAQKVRGTVVLGSLTAAGVL